LIDNGDGGYGEEGTISEFRHGNGGDEVYFLSRNDWEHFDVLDAKFSLFGASILDGVAVGVSGIDGEAQVF
jgi:hypothetical protein